MIVTGLPSIARIPPVISSERHRCNRILWMPLSSSTSSVVIIARLGLSFSQSLPLKMDASWLCINDKQSLVDEANLMDLDTFSRSVCQCAQIPAQCNAM